MAGNPTGRTPQGPSGADQPHDRGEQPPGAAATSRVGTAAVVGACAGALTSLPGSWQTGILVGWDVAAVVYLTWTWTTIWRRDATATAQLALREDPGRTAADVLLLVASVASVFAVGLVISVGQTPTAGAQRVRAGLAVVSVGLSWAVVQAVYTARYARLYYSHPAGGIDFNQEAPPRFSDFAYLAFTVGMTYQVSDTELQTPGLRATLLGHALLSYLLGAVILATAINLVAGLLR